MKKTLLSVLTTAVLAVFCTSANAQTKFYEPDVVYTTNVSSLVGTSVAIINTTDKKAIFGHDAQNVAYEEYEKALRSDIAVLQYKIEADGDNYMLRCVTPEGVDYGLWGQNPCYLNCQPDGRDNLIFNLGNGNQKGTDCENGGVWIIAATEGGFTIQNLATNKYLGKGNQRSETPVVFQFATLKAVEKTNPIPVPERAATDALELQITEGNKNENGQYQGMVKLSWPEGIDLSQYQYLTITMGQNTDGGNVGPVKIVDNKAVTVQGDEYGEPNFNMWFGQWNHHITCLIDLEKLRENKWLNVYDIRELSINCTDPVIINNIYASNEKPKTKIFWQGFENNEGTYQRLTQAAGSFGTICLPYQAAYAGVNVYGIADVSAEGIELEEVEGLTEAGKPYFYCVNAPIAKGKPVGAFFYKASAAEVEAGENNGLVGTFEDITAPMDSYVLSNNKTYLVDSEVTIGANKAYILKENIVATGAEAKVIIPFEDADATAIKNVEKALNADKIYDINGREVKSMQKGGIYIMGGMKVMVK